MYHSPSAQDVAALLWQQVSLELFMNLATETFTDLSSAAASAAQLGSLLHTSKQIRYTLHMVEVSRPHRIEKTSPWSFQGKIESDNTKLI